MSQLTIIEKLSPSEIFGSNNIDKILGKISEEVDSEKIDVSTKAGREQLASLAYKISRSKTSSMILEKSSEKKLTKSTWRLIMSAYYPDDINPNSKDCPWNQKETLLEECPDCEGKGYFLDHDELDTYRVECFECHGEGHIEVEYDDEEQWEEE